MSTRRVPQNRYLIAGAPGCGKTTALIKRIAQAVEEEGSGDGILIASLTKTAAREIAARVAQRIMGVEFPHVGTVHALALRALKMEGDEPKLVYDPDYIKEFNETYNRALPLQLGRVLFDPDAVKRDVELLGRIDTLRASKVIASSWPASCLRLAAQWEQFKSFHGVLDFTDLIQRSIAILKIHPAEPAYIFVDEAQDLSALEMDLIEQWAQHTKKTIVAGDDEQALYEWRGASVKAFMNFAIPENQYVLPRSYRMAPAVARVAQGISRRISQRIPKEYELVNEHEGSVIHRHHGATANLVQSELRDNRVQSVMVLATCGYMLKPFLKDISLLGIPFHNPYRTSSEGKTWNPLKSKLNRTLLKFLQPSRGQHLWTYRDLYDMTHILENIPRQATINYNRNSTKVADPEWADEVLPDWFKVAAADGDLHAYVRNVKRVGKGKPNINRISYLKRIWNIHGPRGLETTPRLIVGTIHSVKGGEADVVFVLPWMSPAANRASLAGPSDSVLRTFYVGVSRARQRLYMMTDPQSRHSFWR